MVAESQSWDGKKLAVYLIAFTLAIGPFFNGMFFEPIRLLGAALPCVAYWLWYSHRPDTAPSCNGVDISALTWFLSYVIASITPVLPRGQLSVLLDMVAFLAVYTVLRFTPRLEQSIGRILMGSGLVMVTLSVARLAGEDWLGRYFVDLVIGGRLSGGFQYANTFAVWLFCLTLLALREARTPRLGNLFLIIGGLFAGAFMLTLSRGALVAAPVAYLAVLVLGSREDRLFTAWTALLTWGPAFVLGNAALRALQEEQTAVGLAALAACALPPLAAPYLAKITEFVWSSKRTWGISAGGVLLLGVVAAVAKVAPKVLPALTGVTENRMTSGYQMSDANIFTRLMFDSWAWRILSANHFVGAGGRAWTKLYFQVQSFPYFTTEVHNHFLQTGVEAGLLGLLAFTAMLACCLVIAWRSRKQQQGESSLAIWAGVATYIGIHSAMDFDLSYISLLLLLAVAAGVISSRSAIGLATGSQWLRRWHHALAAVTVLAFLTAGSLFVSQGALLASDEAWARGDVPGTLSRLRLAQKLDPLDAEPWLRMEALKSADPAAGAALPDRKVLLSNARALDRVNPAVTLGLADIALQEQRWVQGADLAMKADSFVPLDQDVNAAVASMLWTAASSAAQSEEMPAARALAARLKAYDVELNRRFAVAVPYAPYARAPVAYTDTSRLRIGQGLLVTGDYAAAADHLRNAAKSQALKAEAEQWLFVALDLGGNKQEAEKLRQANPGLYTQFLQSDLYQKVVTAAKS